MGISFEGGNDGMKVEQGFAKCYAFRDTPIRDLIEEWHE